MADWQISWENPDEVASQIVDQIAKLPKLPGPLALASLPKLAVPTARFYEYLVENYDPRYADPAGRITHAIHNYISDLTPCGYYEIDNTLEELGRQHTTSEAEHKVSANQTTFPTVRDIELNRENLLQILRYEPDESFRKEAYLAAVESHPENRELFKEMIRERIGKPGTPGRRICQNPTEFLEEYAKQLDRSHSSKMSWNWTYIDKPSAKLPAENAVRRAMDEIAAIFGISFYPVEMNLWCKSLVYEIDDTGRRVILDIWNRPGKIRRAPFTSTLGDYILLVCYYDEYVSESEMVTFYHEMGHVLHFAYSRVRNLLAPFEQDFGEIPGVLMEYLKKRPSIEHIGRQIGIGLFDIYIHRGEDPELAAKAAFRYWLPGGMGHFWYSFEHFASSYGGLYYQYPMAYWYAERLLPIVKSNPKRWLALLAKVGQQPAEHLLREFLELKPTNAPE